MLQLIGFTSFKDLGLPLHTPPLRPQWETHLLVHIKELHLLCLFMAFKHFCPKINNILDFSVYGCAHIPN
jgi:hypothetical protein